MDSFALGGAIAYGICVLAFSVYIYKIKIPYFSNRLLQQQNVMKKIIYPIFVIMNFSDQFLIFLLMLGILISEIIFDFCNNMYPLKSTMTLFKTL